MKVSVNKSMASVANVPQNGVIGKQDLVIQPMNIDYMRIRNRSPSQGAQNSAMSRDSPTFYGVKRHSEDVPREKPV